MVDNYVERYVEKSVKADLQKKMFLSPVPARAEKQPLHSGFCKQKWVKRPGRFT